VIGRTAPNGAHQPLASCARQHGKPSATALPLQCWQDTTNGKCTLPTDATQAPDPSERGEVAGRLHARVGRRQAAKPVVPQRLTLCKWVCSNPELPKMPPRNLDKHAPVAMPVAVARTAGNLCPGIDQIRPSLLRRPPPLHRLRHSRPGPVHPNTAPRSVAVFAQGRLGCWRWQGSRRLEWPRCTASTAAPRTAFGLPVGAFLLGCER